MRSIAVLAVFLVLVVCSCEGRKGKGCRYNKAGSEWSVCDPVTQTKTRTLRSREGSPSNCRPKVKTKKCSNCQYSGVTVGECDPATKRLVISKVLDPSTSPDLNCEPFKNKTKRCRPVKITCQYGPPTVGDCDMTANTFVISRILLDDQDAGCEQFKNKTKLCKKKKGPRRARGCKYNKSVDWDTTACDQEGGMATRTLLKTKGSDLCPASRMATISCKKLNKKLDKKARKNERKENRKKDRKQSRKQDRQDRRERRKNRKNRGPACKYSNGEWSDCDMTTDTMSKTMTLVSGLDTCEQTKVINSKCRKSCKYTRGSWGECDPNTHFRERVDSLKESASKDFCESTRKIQKKCGRKAKKSKKGCVYESGSWGDCNVLSGQRTKTKTLVSGDTTKCQLEKTVSRPCARRNGKERCFFGKWQEWEQCRNGVERKQREVLQGGDNCQRKSVRTRSCTEGS